MNIRRVLYTLIAISFGAFMFVYGEFDDSPPGGQLLGLLFVILGIVGVIKEQEEKFKLTHTISEHIGIDSTC